MGIFDGQVPFEVISLVIDREGLLGFYQRLSSCFSVSYEF